MSQFTFLISFLVLGVRPRHLKGMSRTLTGFFSRKHFGRNFDTRRIFYEKPIFLLVGKGPKMTLDLEKCDFSANVRITRPISLMYPKKPYLDRHLF